MHRSEVKAAIKYYSDSRDVALLLASKYKTPLSVQAQLELRHHYSNCLASLVALIEYLRDDAYIYSADFKAVMDSNFVFPGYGDAVQNYDYLRELRNMVVHRGGDLTSAAHISEDGVPIPVLPEEVGNRSLKRFHKCYQRYLPRLIIETVDVLDPVISDHIDRFVDLLPEMTPEDVEAHIKLNLFNDSFIYPTEIKSLILEAFDIQSLSDMLATATAAASQPKT